MDGEFIGIDVVGIDHVHFEDLDHGGVSQGRNRAVGEGPASLFDTALLDGEVAVTNSDLERLALFDPTGVNEDTGIPIVSEGDAVDQLNHVSRGGGVDRHGGQDPWIRCKRPVVGESYGYKDCEPILPKMLDKADLAKPPRAFTEDEWSKIPPDEQGEALSRASFIMMRGGVTPGQALDLAFKGMEQDLSHAEGEVSWATIHPLIGAWPPPARFPDGRIRRGIVELAELTEGFARAEIEVGGQLQVAIQGIRDAAPSETVANIAIAEFRKMVTPDLSAMMAEPEAEVAYEPEPPPVAFSDEDDDSVRL